MKKNMYNHPNCYGVDEEIIEKMEAIQIDIEELYLQTITFLLSINDGIEKKSLFSKELQNLHNALLPTKETANHCTFSALAIAENTLCWFFYEKGYLVTASILEELFNKTNNKAYQFLKGEEATLYFKLTD